MVAAEAAAAAPALPERGLVLVSGPSRSGKSRWAEHLARCSGRPVLYLATGPERPGDASWQERLQLHRQQRPAHWRTQEVGGQLAEALAALQRTTAAEALPAHQRPVLLIDALGTWLAHHLEADGAAWSAREQQLLEQLAALEQPALLVCEEVGWGVVPATAIGGLFRDRLGRLQQRLMAQSAGAWLVVQGRALNLHALGLPVPEA